MNLKGTLVRIANVIAEEASRNPEFNSSLQAALGIRKSPAKPSSLPGEIQTPKQATDDEKTAEKRRGGRRSLAVLDPVELVSRGEAELRERLAGLSLDLLHDIVAQYGMDPGKLVMKWRDPQRVIDRIAEVAAARATKGDAFRKD